MTFNEINNQSNTSADIFGWTNSGVLFSEYTNKKKAMYQAAHHELLASAIVVKKGHEINPEFQIRMYVFFCSVLSVFLQSRRCYDCGRMYCMKDFIFQTYI